MKGLPKFTKWFVFKVTIGLTPMIYAVLRNLTFSRPLNLQGILGHGELFILSVAIGGAAIGELINSTKKFPVLKTICGGGCLLTMLTAISWFTDVVSAYETTTPPDQSVVAYGSVIVFGLTVLAGGGCIILSEK